MNVFGLMVPYIMRVVDEDNDSCSVFSHALEKCGVAHEGGWDRLSPFMTFPPHFLSHSLLGE